jgi:spore coat protein U-like protein
MIGSTNSDDNLTVFRNNKLENVVVSTYVDKLEVTINYEEKK